MKSSVVLVCFAYASILHSTKSKSLLVYDMTEALNAILNGKLSVENFSLEYEFHYRNNQSYFYVLYDAGKTKDKSEMKMWAILDSA